MVVSLPISQDLPQWRLNLEGRERTSLFPWRGQFSPELIEFLLDIHATEDSTVLDPFVGSGTTLIESARRRLACCGSEINPAAVQFSGIARFVSIDAERREQILCKAQNLIDRLFGTSTLGGLFNGLAASSNFDIRKAVRTLLQEASPEALLHNVITVSVMMAMGNGDTLHVDALYRAFRRTRDVVLALPFSDRPCQVLTSDARRLPLKDRSVDLILTSPPYINVFNYHQNYRKAMELMGWSPLDVAPSEIGANRKHRANRFLTVIQYCIDMLEVMREMHRVLKDSGTAVITVGRESCVLGVSFKNSQLLAMLAVGGARFRLISWHERRFRNRFGQWIYEDLLTFKPDETLSTESSEDFGRLVGTWALSSARKRAPEQSLPYLEEAIREADTVEASPVYRPGAVQLKLEVRHDRPWQIDLPDLPGHPIG